jgi:hypothetical protein
VQAYRTARSDLQAFEQALQDPSGLGKFDGIRATLQAAVQTYDTQLQAYYQRHAFRLQRAAEIGQPAAVTPTALVAPSAATAESGEPLE